MARQLAYIAEAEVVIASASEEAVKPAR